MLDLEDCHAQLDYPERADQQTQSTRGGEPAGSYSTAFARVDGPPSCPVLPRDETGATAVTGADHFAECFSIPADQHAATETFRYLRTTGAGAACPSSTGLAGAAAGPPCAPATARSTARCRKARPH